METRNAKIESRPPNWLPLPGEGLGEKLEEPRVEEDDLFPKGEVASFFPRQGYGYIGNDRGQKILFRLSEVTLVGPKGHRRYLLEGARVGYDVSWTSHGLHTSRIKIY